MCDSPDTKAKNSSKIPSPLSQIIKQLSEDLFQVYDRFTHISLKRTPPPP